MAAPLALDVAPHGELPGWRRGEEALDSLAYIDEFTEQEKAAVEQLIMDEVCAHHGSQLLQQELSLKQRQGCDRSH